MSHLPFTLLAYFFNGIAVLIDKYLLVKKVTDPFVYIFYISLVSLIILVFLPLTHFPSMPVFFLSSASTVLWTFGAYYMYRALQVGLVSRVIPVIGTLIPLILLVEAVITNSITIFQLWAIVLLILGIIFLTIMDWGGRIKRGEIVYVFLSAIFFAISYVFLRLAYLQEQFFTVLVWSRIILLPIGALVLIVPKMRKELMLGQERGFPFASKSGALFVVGKFAGGISELLLTFSVSLATPALVNSLQGTQYGFLYLFSFFLARKMPQVYAENHSLFANTAKIVGIVFVAIGLYLLAFSPQRI